MNREDLIVAEIISHECEKHDLLYLGVIKEFGFVAEQIGRKVVISSDFNKTKSDVLSEFYKAIGFSEFIHQNKIGGADHKIKVSVRYHINRLLKQWEEQNPGISPDKELKVHKTIAYWLSKMIFDIFYSEFCDSKVLFATPNEVKQFFSGLTREKYPLAFPDFIIQLELCDSEFWDRVGDILLKLSKNVTIPGVTSSVYRDIADGEIVSDSYVVLQQVIGERKVKFNDALHFRKYSYHVCRNKCYEYFRKSRNLRTDSIEDLHVPLDNDAGWDNPEESLPDGNNDMIHDINVDNPYEVAQLLAYTLNNNGHPLYEKIVAGETERVELLLDIAVRDLSYDQVIEKRCKDVPLPADEHKKMNAKLRQDYVRIRKKLVERLEHILGKE